MARRSIKPQRILGHLIREFVWDEAAFAEARTAIDESILHGRGIWNTQPERGVDTRSVLEDLREYGKAIALERRNEELREQLRGSADGHLTDAIRYTTGRAILDLERIRMGELPSLVAEPRDAGPWSRYDYVQTWQSDSAGPYVGPLPSDDSPPEVRGVFAEGDAEPMSRRMFRLSAEHPSWIAHPEGHQRGRFFPDGAGEFRELLIQKRDRFIVIAEIPSTSRPNFPHIALIKCNKRYFLLSAPSDTHGNAIRNWEIQFGNLTLQALARAAGFWMDATISSSMAVDLVYALRSEDTRRKNFR